MSFQLSDFDSTQIDTTDSFSPIPAGDYPVIIKANEWKVTKNGQGRYMQFTLEVIDGEFKGRLLWDRLNLENQNQQAVDISSKQLAKAINAANLDHAPQDFAELQGIPMIAQVKYKEASGNYDASNDIKGYKPLNTGQPLNVQAVPAQVAQQQVSTQPAWK